SYGVMTHKDDIAVERELNVLIASLAPHLPEGIRENLPEALRCWRRLIVSRERLRLLRIINVALDLDLLAEGIEFACRSPLSAEAAISALHSRAASESCGR